MDDRAGFRHSFSLYVNTQRARGKVLSESLLMHARRMMDTLYANGVLRLRGGMPSLALSTDAAKIGLFWPNVSPIEQFCLWIDAMGGHTVQLPTGQHAPVPNTDATRMLMAMLKGMQTGVQYF